MKMAIVCDDLVQHGGHEHVIKEFTKLYPKATLFTTMATRSWMDYCESHRIKLRTTFMQKLPFKRSLGRYYAPFLLYIIALESIDLDSFDVVVSLSSRFSHGVITKPKTLHITYMSTVGRMFWEPHSYFAQESFWGVRFLKRLAKGFLSFPLSHIRIWDRTAAQRPDLFLTISRTSQRRIGKYYQREADIIYPPVDVDKFSAQKEDIPNDYFLIVTRLASWKRVDLAINVCKTLGRKLKIVGEGPDRSRLEAIAKDSDLIEFLGYISEDEKIKYMQNCQALIMTQYEDFGLTPIETMASGKPVIAYAKGGVLETVLDGQTGLFYKEQNEESLEEVIRVFDDEIFDEKVCKSQAKLFDKLVFKNEMESYITENHKRHCTK